jgi:putative ABC transport system substrate-binding protein
MRAQTARMGAGFRIARLLMTAMALLSLCGIARTQETGIVLLASARSAMYEDFISAYREYLRLPGDAHVTTLYLDDSHFSKKDIATDAGLLVTIGTRAAQLVLDDEPGIPVLNTLIPASSFHALTGVHADCKRSSAIFIEQPVLRQALLAHLLFPDAHRYGILLGPTSDNRRAEIEDIDHDITAAIDLLTVTREPGTVPQARQLVRQDDLMLGVYDPLVLNRENARWLLYTAYQEQHPVIGFSQAYVRAGAAAAVYSTPAQFARQAAEMTIEWMKDRSQCLPPPQFPRHFEVAVNRAVCESLGCRNLPEDELARAIQDRESPR